MSCWCCWVYRTGFADKCKSTLLSTIATTFVPTILYLKTWISVSKRDHCMYIRADVFNLFFAVDPTAIPSSGGGPPSLAQGTLASLVLLVQTSDSINGIRANTSEVFNSAQCCLYCTHNIGIVAFSWNVTGLIWLVHGPVRLELGMGLRTITVKLTYISVPFSNRHAYIRNSRYRNSSAPWKMLVPCAYSITFCIPDRYIWINTYYRPMLQL